MEIEQYFKNLEIEVRKVYALAEKTRAKGLDPVKKVEIPLAKSLAEKVVSLISTIYPQLADEKIINRIIDLEKEYGKLDTAVAFKIAEEVAKQKFCQFKSLLEAIDAGIRVGFAYVTLGVVSSPIEGYTELKLNKTKDGKDYFVAYFSGPIRSAGTTASCVVLMLIDYLRELFGYAKYDPTNDEVRRYVTENYDYHERVTNLQYLPAEKEIEFLAKNIPIQISGEPTEKREVSNYKNLERVETNFIRGGMCLVFSEGLAQKAKKGFRLLGGLKTKGFQITGWDFLEKYLELQKKRDVGKSDDSPVYIKDMVAGRPVFGHPSRSGAFRFRYGRGRVSGFSATSLHPATMAITDGFISIGTQLKLEKPSKGCAVTVCDVIDGPIVKLFNGNVRKIKTKEEAKKIYNDVEEIIYLGDILFPFSDLANRNDDLIKPGYVPEWWELDLKEKTNELQNIDYFNVDLETAVDISKKYNIPLHPNHTFFWSQISLKQFFVFIHWLKHARVADKLIFPYNKTEREKFEEGKRTLELIGVEHQITIEDVVLSKEDSKAILINLGIADDILNSKEISFIKNIIEELEEKISHEKIEEGKVLDIINKISDFEIKDKAGDFIGARMAKPEKAKLRKLTGNPNVLFSVGNEGGRLRSLQAACVEGKVRSSFPLFYCGACNKETIYPSCEICAKECEKMYYLRETNEKSFTKNFGNKENVKEGTESCVKDLDINHYFAEAVKKIGIEKTNLPVLIKGVRGLSSDSKIPEHLEKGILRAKFNLQVNKDGTIRFDANELPLIAFKPKEIGVPVWKIKELGYDVDVFGNVLENEEQILELMPHDILLPSCSETLDERADDVFFRIANFIDELLERFYGLERFHNISKKEDLVGQLGVCMSPHNCAGVICRILGFSNTQGLLASPYMHAAMRRDCDGDEAAVMLLSDVLINFSREFLPSHRGGSQDAPLVLNARIDAGEVDDQILDFEIVGANGKYPLDLYRKAEQRIHSSQVGVYNVKKALKENKNPFFGIGFTHDTSDFNSGVICSSYKLLPTMQEKVQHQMELVEKIRAVDTSDTARLIIERHFLSDIKGNLRKFSMQGFRCVSCNEILRRPPLAGVCPVCKGKIIFTIHEGGIKKYLEHAIELANKYNLSPYLKQSIELTKRYIDSVFGKELEKQETIKKWF